MYACKDWFFRRRVTPDGRFRIARKTRKKMLKKWKSLKKYLLYIKLSSLCIKNRTKILAISDTKLERQVAWSSSPRSLPTFLWMFLLSNVEMSQCLVLSSLPFSIYNPCLISFSLMTLIPGIIS